MTQMHEDPWARLTERVDRQVAAADATLAQARDHAEAAARLSAEGHARGVEVAVDHQGLLTRVSISRGAHALPPEALAHAVHAAFRAAVADLGEKHRRCALRAWGESEVGRRIAAETAQRFAASASDPGDERGDGAPA